MDNNGIPYIIGQGQTGPTGPQGPPGPNQIAAVELIQQVSIPSIPSNEAAIYTNTGSQRLNLKRGNDQSVSPIAEMSDLLSYLPLSGGTMTGGIDFNNTNASNINVLSFAGSDQITMIEQSSLGTITSGSDALYAETTTHRIKRKRGDDQSVDTMVEQSDLNAYLLLSGGQMTGDIDMNNHELKGVKAMRTYDDNVVIGNGADAISGNGSVVIGRNANVGFDSNIAIGDGAATDNLAGSIAIGTSAHNSQGDSFLFGGASITNIRPANNNTCDLGSNSATFKDAYVSGTLTGINNIVPSGSDCIFGNGSTATGGSVAVGDGATAGFSQDVAIGQNAHGNALSTAVGAGASCTGNNDVALGNGATSTAQYGIAIGQSASAENVSAIAIGANSVSSNTNSIFIGDTGTNATAHSFLFGDSAVVNIRPNNDATCDLGTNLARYKDLYLSNSVQGTPSIDLTNGTNLPISTGVSGLGTGVSTFLGTPSSANLASAVTDETGSGALVFATSPTLVTPVLGTPASGTLTNCTGYPVPNTLVSSTSTASLSNTVGSYTALTSASLTGTNGGVYLISFDGTFTYSIDPANGGAFRIQLFDGASGVAKTVREISWNLTATGSSTIEMVLSFHSIETSSGNAWTVQYEQDVSGSPVHGPWTFSMIRLA